MATINHVLNLAKDHYLALTDFVQRHPHAMLWGSFAIVALALWL